jgi:coenzyme PQQ precursor peptide PqqA
LSIRISKEFLMTWTTPKITEVAVGMEINCYACAELTD